MAGNDTSQTSKETIRRFVEALNAGRLEGLADDYVEHDLAYPGATSSRETVEAKMDQLSESLSDLTLTIEDMVAEEATVAVRAIAEATQVGEFFGAAPTDERLRWSVTLFARVEAGAVAEVHVLRDRLGIMQQLGLNPAGET